MITSTKVKLIDKVRLIAQTTSERYFSGLKLEVMGIDSINGVLTLKVNLIENKDFTPTQHPSWFQYFQGSYGGMQTSNLLITNFLQTDYEAKWIDNIKFYYQGNEFGEWDHIYLGLHSRY